MDDKEIDKLAREIAELHFLNCPEDSEILKEHIHDIKVYIRDILRTHAIVPKEKVIEAYNGWEQFFWLQTRRCCTSWQVAIRGYFWFRA